MSSSHVGVNANLNTAIDQGNLVEFFTLLDEQYGRDLPESVTLYDYNYQPPGFVADYQPRKIIEEFKSGVVVNPHNKVLALFDALKQVSRINKNDVKKWGFQVGYYAHARAEEVSNLSAALAEKEDFRDQLENFIGDLDDAELDRIVMQFSAVYKNDDILQKYRYSKSLEEKKQFISRKIDERYHLGVQKIKKLLSDFNSQFLTSEMMKRYGNASNFEFTSYINPSAKTIDPSNMFVKFIAQTYLCRQGYKTEILADKLGISVDQFKVNYPILAQSRFDFLLLPFSSLGSETNANDGFMYELSKIRYYRFPKFVTDVCIVKNNGEILPDEELFDACRAFMHELIAKSSYLENQQYQSLLGELSNVLIALGKSMGQSTPGYHFKDVIDPLVSALKEIKDNTVFRPSLTDLVREIGVASEAHKVKTHLDLQTGVVEQGKKVVDKNPALDACNDLLSALNAGKFENTQELNLHLQKLVRRLSEGKTVDIKAVISEIHKIIINPHSDLDSINEPLKKLLTIIRDDVRLDSPTKFDFMDKKYPRDTYVKLLDKLINDIPQHEARETFRHR